MSDASGPSGPPAGGRGAGVPVADGVTRVAGVRVGHWTDLEARTGCTVLLWPDGGAVTSGLVLGAAPGGRETSLLDPERTVESSHALLLTG
ncbi:MAG: P1 family peptidase, partial [Trueperaceae bacterium]